MVLGDKIDRNSCCRFGARRSENKPPHCKTLKYRTAYTVYQVQSPVGSWCKPRHFQLPSSDLDSLDQSLNPSRGTCFDNSPAGEESHSVIFLKTSSWIWPLLIIQSSQVSLTLTGHGGGGGGMYQRVMEKRKQEERDEKKRD